MSLQDELQPASDCFWELENYKHTIKRTEDGMQMWNEIMKFIQERADIEKEYAKRLKAWAKKWNESFDKGTEYGTTKATLKGALDEANRMGDEHLAIKDRLLNEVQTEVKEWKNENYKKQMVGGCKEAKTFEDDFKKAQKPWSKRLTKVLKCKKDYHIACKLEKTAANQENNARNSSDVSADQVKKFQEKVEKCRKDVEQTKEKYNAALTELNAYNARYVEDMTEVFNRTQEFEDKRLLFIKKVLFDMHACLDLTKNKSISEIYDQFKATIDSCDVTKDLKWWSESHGVEMPMYWPAFEEYSTEFHCISRKEKAKSMYVSGVSDGITLTAVQKGNDASSAAKHIGLMDCRPTSALVQSCSSQNPFGEDDWDEYDNTALQDDQGSGGSGGAAGEKGDGDGVQVRALYNYEGQEDDELTFKAGDIFLKIKDRDDQGWCTGCKDGRVGLYPDNYVELMNNGH